MIALDAPGPWWGALARFAAPFRRSAGTLAAVGAMGSFDAPAKSPEVAVLPAPLEPGSEFTVPWPGLAHPLVVHLPENHAPGRRWPVIFHYHGTGGRPGVAIPRDYTGGRDFVLVGMAYDNAERHPATRDYLVTALATWRSVRDALTGPLGLDTERCYVGGFSKGGWFASEFAEVAMKEFAGAYIVGAGKSHRRPRQPVPFPSTRPVYIGIGQLDPNFAYAVRAVDHFRALGGTVTFDEFPGHGHVIGLGSERPFPRSEGLRQWFAVEAARGRGDGLRGDVAAWCARWRAQAERLSDDDPATATLVLLHARRMPYHRFIRSGSDGDEIEARLRECTQLPAVAVEMDVRSRYFALLEEESAEESWDHYVAVARRFVALHREFPATHAGRCAALSADRLRGLLEQTERWRFPDPEARERARAEYLADPIPALPEADALARGMRSLYLRLQGIDP